VVVIVAGLVGDILRHLVGEACRCPAPKNLLRIDVLEILDRCGMVEFDDFSETLLLRTVHLEIPELTDDFMPGVLA